MVLALEGGLELSEVGVFADYLCQYFFLSQDALQSFKFSQVFLFYLLQGKQLPASHVPHQKYSC